MNVKRLTLLTCLLLLSVTLTGGILTTAQTEEPDLKKGLVAYWSFDEGEGDIVFDESGNHNDGALMCTGEGCSPPKWVKGKIGYALEFDGVDDYVKIMGNESLAFKPDNSFSIVAWVQLEELEQEHIIRRDGDKSTLGWYLLRIRKEKSQLQILDHAYQNTSTITGSTRIKEGQWYLVAGVRNSKEDKLYLYVNGELDTKPVDDKTKDTLGTGNLFIGANPALNTFLKGMVDEVRIYNKVLTKEEVQELQTQAKKK